MLTRFRVALLSLTLLAATMHAEKAAAQSAGDVATQVIDVTVRPKVVVRYLYLVPNTVWPRPTTPRPAVMLFAGGNGALKIAANGSIGTDLAQNFLVRSRLLFARSGLAVAVVDTPGGGPIDGNIRLSAQYAQDMAVVIADLRSRAQAEKVWLVGTSAGTLSAAGIAARLPLQTARIPPPNNTPRPDGIVLTATQSTVVDNQCGKTVFNATLSAINVPAYVVAHRNDACPCSPAKAAPAVLAALTQSPARERFEFVGGDPAQSSNPCDALTPHGFLGIEPDVVASIATWVKTH
jgi:hypothetical protein